MSRWMEVSTRSDQEKVVVYKEEHGWLRKMDGRVQVESNMSTGDCFFVQRLGSSHCNVFRYQVSRFTMSDK